MENRKKRADRRTLNTKKTIRDTFLELKKKKSYSSITVADICREAKISRGTFYLHFRNTAEVLEEVLEEALADVSSLAHQLYPDSCGDVRCGLPMCCHIRENQEYRCLLLDDELSGKLLEKIFSIHKEEIIRLWQQPSDLSRQQQEMIAWFQLCGCFAAAKKSLELDGQQWDQVRMALDTFLRGGFQAVGGGCRV